MEINYSILVTLFYRYIQPLSFIQNPLNATFQHHGRNSVNMWCSIIRDTIIRTYFFEEALTGITFLKLLGDELPLVRRGTF